MKILTDHAWLKWNSVSEAWDEQLVKGLDYMEKLKTLGRPVYAFYQRGYPVEYVAFFYEECENIYPQKMIDSSIRYYEANFYPGLRKTYEELVLERNRFLTDK